MTKVIRFDPLFARSGWGNLAPQIGTSIALLIDSRRDGIRSAGLLQRIARGRLGIKSSTVWKLSKRDDRDYH